VVVVVVVVDGFCIVNLFTVFINCHLLTDEDEGGLMEGIDDELGR
jgi:hypothetical protein